MFSQLKIRHPSFLLPAPCSMSLLSCGGTQTPTIGQVPDGMTVFVGGEFDASGVADVPGSGGVLFVDNGREGQVWQ